MSSIFSGNTSHDEYSDNMGRSIYQTTANEDSVKFEELLDAVSPDWRHKKNSQMPTMEDILGGMQGNSMENRDRLYESMYLARQFGVHPNEVMGNMEAYENQFFRSTTPIARGWKAITQQVKISDAGRDRALSANRLAELNQQKIMLQKRYEVALEASKKLVNDQKTEINDPNFENLSFEQKLEIQKRAGQRGYGNEYEKENADEYMRQIQETDRAIAEATQSIGNYNKQLESSPEISLEMPWYDLPAQGAMFYAKNKTTFDLMGDMIRDTAIGSLAVGAITGGAGALANVAQSTRNVISAVSTFQKGEKVRKVLSAVAEATKASTKIGLIKGLKYGSKAGQLIGAIDGYTQTHDMSAGETYFDLTSVGVGHEIAYDMSRQVGALSGAMEFAADLVATGMLKGVTHFALSKVMNKSLG